VVAYIVVVLFLLITGGMFFLSFFEGPQELSLRRFFADAPFFLTFFAPAMTMGLFAEEKRSGTLELLMTMPVSDTQIVLGKFFASVSLLVVVLLFTLPYPLTLYYLGELDWGPVAGGYLGLLFLGAAYMAVGLMVSSWTRDQIVAILLSFFLCFALFIVDRVFGPQSGTASKVLEYLSANYHFTNIARGVIDARDLVYYLSVMLVGLTAARTSLASRRW
jgi:ABC-2 type transport system permease protein